MQNIQSTKISGRHQTVVPTTVRKALKVKAGDRITWYITCQDDQPVVIASSTHETHMSHGRGLGKHLWEDVSIDTYINSLRKEWHETK